MVVNFLIRKSDSSTFPSPYLCVFLISIYTYGFPSIYIYIFKVSNSYEFELPRMSILLIGIVKIFAPVRYCLRFCSHSIPRWGKVGCRNLCERFSSDPESCFGKSIHPGYHSQSKPKGRNWCERGFKLVLFWESHAPQLLLLSLFIYLFYYYRGFLC